MQIIALWSSIELNCKIQINSMLSMLSMPSMTFPLQRSLRFRIATVYFSNDVSQKSKKFIVDGDRRLQWPMKFMKLAL